MAHLHLLRMRWLHPVFLHWPMSPIHLARRLPDGVELDLYDGHAWMSLVALAVDGPVPGPLLPLARLQRYRQINLRTYVTGARGPGLFVFETRVDRLIAMAARALGAPYRLDRRVRVEVAGTRVDVHTGEAAVSARVEDAEPMRPARGLDAFLLERYWTYQRLPGGPVVALRVEHEPWRVAPLVDVRAPEPPAAAHLGADREVGLVEISSAPPPRLLGLPPPSLLGAGAG
jgi:hypothetical protein